MNILSYSHWVLSYDDFLTMLRVPSIVVRGGYGVLVLPRVQILSVTPVDVLET
jgi:hypothetical protein